MWRDRIRRILELREILMSFQTGFNLVNTAVLCTILESISGLEPPSVVTEPRHLKLVTASSFCPFTLISVSMPQRVFLLLKLNCRYLTLKWSRRVTSRPNTSPTYKKNTVNDKHNLLEVVINKLVSTFPPAFAHLSNLKHLLQGRHEVSVLLNTK